MNILVISITHAGNTLDFRDKCKKITFWALNCHIKNSQIGNKKNMELLEKKNPTMAILAVC